MGDEMRVEVLEILEENRGKSVKGSEMAKMLGCSRNAIWKVMNSLKKDGYDILAATNRGYMLSGNDDQISEVGIKMHLKTKYLGKTFLLYKSLESTNTTAKALADEGAFSGTVVIAEEQTKGRGRMGRTFFSPKGEGIYMSIILRPKLTAEAASLITACVAVAVSKAIEKIAHIDAKIKWVNDIFIDDKKVCGILTEASLNFENNELLYIVVGIGINTAVTSFPNELQDIAASISSGDTEVISRNRLICEILNEIESEYANFQSKGFLAEYKKRSSIIGKEIVVVSGETRSSAIAIDIDENCGLVIKDSEGNIKVLRSGEVSIRKTIND